MTTKAEFAPLMRSPEVATPTKAAGPKRREPPAKVKAAIEELLSGRCRTITAAAERVLLSRERLSRALSEPHITAYLQQKAARHVAVSSAAAAARITELLHAESEHVQFKAAEHILSVAGITPTNAPQVSVSIELKAGYVIDLSEPGEPAPKIIGGDVIDAKPAD